MPKDNRIFKQFKPSRMKRLIHGALAILCFISCKHGGPHYLLRLKYNKGVQTDLEYHSYIVSNDNQTDAIRNEVVRMGFKVDTVVHDSLFTLSAKVDYIRVVDNGEFQLLNFSYTTEEPPTGNNQNAQRYNLLVKPLVDSTLALTVSSKGTLTKPFTFSHGRRLPGSPPLNYEMCQIKFPADSIAIGEEWTNERIDPLRNARWVSHYYIESIKDGAVNIKLYGVIEIGVKKNKFTGDYVIEQKTGALTSGKIEIEGQTMTQGKGKLVIDITSREWGFQ